ncbi:MAG: amidase, partial [Gammaproteobacteria bacterium]|nr:amidase [Gammaproteobacteria bacterium]
LQGKRFGVPVEVFQDELDPEVARAFTRATELLEAAGATLVAIEVPETHERETVFPAIVAPELVARLTPDRLRDIAPAMDTVTRARAEMALDIKAVEHAAALQRHHTLKQLFRSRFDGLDGWLTPTCPALPVTLASLQEPAVATRSLLSSRNTQPINLFGLCAANVPLTAMPGNESTTLPTGLQLVCPAGEDRKLLELATAMEAVFGSGRRPELKE